MIRRFVYRQPIVHAHLLGITSHKHSNRLSTTFALLLILLPLINISAHAESVIDISQQEKIFFFEHAEHIYSDSSVKDARFIIDQFSSDHQQTNPVTSRKKIELNNSSNIWFKLSLFNPTAKNIELFLVAGDATIPWIQLTVIKDGNIVRQETGGADFPLQERSVNHRLLLIPISIAAGETLTLVTGMDNHNIVQRVWIEPQTHFWADENLTTLTDGMYLGAILLIGFMTSLLYISDRRRLYLYIYIIVIANTLYHFCRNGYAQHFLWPTTPGVTGDCAIATLNLSVLGGILFSMNFLKLTKQKQRWPFILSITYLIITISTVPANFLSLQDITLPLIKISTNMATLYFALIWCHALTRSFKRDNKARLYTIVWLFYLIPYLVPVMLSYNDMPNELSKLLISRNGDMFLVIALWMTLLLNVRKTHIEKNAAVLESKAKSEFLAKMSHELRTPLNGVIGMGELLHQTEQTSIQRHYSDVIVSSGHVLLRLINDILDLSKLNEGKLEFEQKPFRLDQILPECISPFIPEMIKQDTFLYSSISADTPFNLIGDEYRLRQILFNLFSNAMKFTENGEVRLIVSCRPTDKASVVEIIFEVIDNGIGIEETALVHIFDQFSQADVSTTRRFGGTGLGLTITKAIVEQMNGWIRARSTLGKGSTFTVCLPMRVDLDAEQQRKEKLTVLSGKRVLAIRDNDNVFCDLESHLKSWGMTIDIVDGIEQANSQRLMQQQAGEPDYDIVIAYFINEPEKQLNGLQMMAKPLIILHHAPLDSDRISWQNEIYKQSVPASIDKLADTFIDMLIKNGQTPDSRTNAQAPLQHSSTAVLVVEDNQTNQLVVKGMLKHLGITPDIANNGLEAVNMASERHYDIILMDCEMPVMDGFKASELIMSNRKQPKPYIAALTAHALNNKTNECKKAGIQRVLQKPITVDRLRELFDSIATT